MQDRSSARGLETVQANTVVRQGFKVGDCRTFSKAQSSWAHVSAEICRRTGLRREETAFASTKHILLLNLKGTSEKGEYFIGGKSVGFSPRRPGSMMFIPAGCHWSGWETGASSAAYLSISVVPSWMKSLLGPNNDGPSWAPQAELSFEDPAISAAARGIGDEIGSSGTLSNLVVEGYLASMFAQLVRRQQRQPNRARSGGLPPLKLSRVLSSIEEDLTSPISLSTLAQLADLSIAHFCRAFKQSTGLPPYGYVVQRRVERAKEYLRHSRMPVTEIALMCGFSSSSHFANCFRREVGVPPSAFRRP